MQNSLGRETARNCVRRSSPTEEEKREVEGWGYNKRAGGRGVDRQEVYLLEKRYLKRELGWGSW